MNSSNKEAQVAHLWNENDARTLANETIEKAIFQAQHTEHARKDAAKILATELLEYIRHLVLS